MHYLLLFNKKFFVEWAYVTSGEGMDYHIVDKSAGFPKEYESEVISLSLVPAYLSPTRILKRAIRVFTLPDQFIGLSFIEYAGRDELNRPARMASKVFLVDRELYNIIPDPKFYEQHLEEIGESKAPIEVSRNELIEYLPKYYNFPATNEFKKTIDKLNEESLATIISSLISNKRVVIYGGEEIEIYDIESSQKITSYDVIRTLLYILPKTIRTKLEYLTYSSNIHVTNNQLLFIDKSPEYETHYMKTNDTTIIDLQTGKVWKKHTNRLGKKYTKLILSLLKKNELPKFTVFSDLMVDSYIEMVATSENKRTGFQRVETILDIAEQFMEVGY